MESDISNIKSTPYTPSAFQQNTQKNRVGNESVSKVENVESQTLSKFSEIPLKEAKELIDEVNKIPENAQRNLQFKIDDATSQVVMTIIDKATGDVIKQLPSEEALALAKRLQEAEGDSGGILEDKA